MNYRTLVTHVGEGGVIHEKDSVVVMPEIEANVLISHGLIAAIPKEAAPEVLETADLTIPNLETGENFVSKDNRTNPAIKKAKPKKKKK